MRVSLVALLVVATGAVALPAAAAGGDADAGAADSTATERVVVRYAEGRVGAASADAGADLEQRHTVAAQDDAAMDDVEFIEVAEGEAESAAAELSARSDVVYAEPDAPVWAASLDEVSAALTPNDPYWDQQWGMERIIAPAAWDRTTGSSSVTVAVLDTGVRAHADLGDALVAGRNILDGTSDASDNHFPGHGTGSAGLLAARGNNGIGIAGLCWSCRIMPVKVLDAGGGGSMSNVAEGIFWAVDNGADILNLSLAGRPGDAPHPYVRDAIDYAEANGVLAVASAGNHGGTDPVYPAAFDRVVAVAASTQAENDPRATYSNHGFWVDLAAPGSNVTLNRSAGYQTMNGTSFSVPLVAGVAALALSHQPGASPATIRAALNDTALPLDYVRHGRLRAPQTVDTVGAGAGGACDDARSGGASFTDVSTSNIHAGSIACVVAHEVARGLTTSTYGPDQPVRRDQMATFVANAIAAGGVTLPAPSRNHFSDVDADNVHRRAINQLADAGVLGGTGAGRFQPGGQVTRAQMATFLANAHEKVTGQRLHASANHFSDISGTDHRGNINALYVGGVVAGRGAGLYEPGRVVARDAMASFIVNQLEQFARLGHIQEAR